MITAYCAVISSVDSAIAKHHRRHGQLVHLFANRWTPLVVGRNIGLMTMELFTPARDVLAQRTLGWVAR